jgi:Flp pilus assembly protein TadG
MPRKCTQRPDGQRGSVTLEMVVAFPLLMLLVWVGMQLVLVFFANRVALSAAQEGVRAARQRTGSLATAERRAQRYLDQLGGTLLLHPQVRASRTAEVARVEVTGQAQQLVPLLARLRVIQVVESPRERFRPEAGGSPARQSLEGG